MATSSKIFTRDFIVGTGVNFLLMMNYYMLMVVMNDYTLSTFGTSTGLAGLSASIFIIGAVFSRVISGAVGQKYGTKRLLIIAMGVEVVLSLCYFLPVDFALLMIIRILHGFAYGFASTSITTMVTSLVPDDRKGEGVGYYMLSVTLGAAIGPFVGMGAVNLFGFESVFVLCIVSIVAATAGGLVTRSALDTPGAAAKPAAVAHEKGIHRFLEVSALPVSCVAFFVFFAYSSLITFMNTFASLEGLTTAASFFFVVYAAAMFVTRPFTGRMFDRHGDLPTMVPAFLAFLLGMFLVSRSFDGFMLLGAAALCGYGVGTVQSSCLTLAVQKAALSRLGQANSTFFTVLDIGVGTGPLIMGLFEPLVGYRGLYLSMVGVIAVGFLFYLVVRRRRA